MMKCYPRGSIVPALICLLLSSFISKATATTPATEDVECIIKTSSSSFSGTSDVIYGTFMGDIATSGPHALGSFSDGSKVTRHITLHKVVGNLHSLLLFTNGTDGWLLSESSCEMDGKVYALKGERQWLDSIDLDLLAEYGDGNEPFAQEDTRTLPASPSLMLSVVESWRSLSSSDGVFKPPIASL